MRCDFCVGPMVKWRFPAERDWLAYEKCYAAIQRDDERRCSDECWRSRSLGRSLAAMRRSFASELESAMRSSGLLAPVRRAQLDRPTVHEYCAGDVARERGGWCGPGGQASTRTVCTAVSLRQRD
jgi:hypothetical protein